MGRPDLAQQRALLGLKLAIDLCNAVEAVHDARDVGTGESLNLIHRDIGSRNVLVGFDGRIQLIDLAGIPSEREWRRTGETRENDR